jgi:hypothetical protein
MSESIYLLDFRRGVVTEIDEATPPSGIRDRASGDGPGALPVGAGYVFAALGTPPRADDQRT